MSSQHTHICHKDSLTPTAAAGCDCGEKLLRPADYCHCHRDWGPGLGGCLFLRAAREKSVYLVLTDCHSMMMQKSGRSRGKLATSMASKSDNIKLASQYRESLQNSWLSVRIRL